MPTLGVLSTMRLSSSKLVECAEAMGEMRRIALFFSCWCVEMRQIRGGVAVKCAGAAYQMSTERTEAKETAIYT
jgi:hypothetical protein